MATKDVARHEFIGLNAKIDESRNKSLAGMQGTIIDETKNTFTMLTEKRERKTIIKKDCQIIFSLRNGEKAKINGKILVAKPEDRIKMKIR